MSWASPASSNRDLTGDDGGASGSLEVVTSCVSLFALAVAQPLLGLLGESPEFFLASDATRVEIVAVAVVTVVVPLLVGLALIGLYRLNIPVGRALHGAVLVLFGTVLGIVVSGHTPLAASPWWVQLSLAAAGGAGVALAFFRYEAVRSLLNFAAVALVVVPAFFLFVSPTSRLVFHDEVVGVAGVTVVDPPPIVVMVFDEFPVASLIDGAGRLQADLYPNFARLASDATWYRNAVTTHRLTRYAVPAVLTGSTPGEETLPNATDHPHSLFTLLGAVYDVDVIEPVTALCPEQVCADSSIQPLPARRRWRAMAADLRIVAGHVFLPADLARGLPPIDQAWAGFAEPVAAPSDPAIGFGEDFNMLSIFREHLGAGRKEALQAFVERIEPVGDRPSLDYVHAMVPHTPWEYLPDGRRFVPPASPIPGADGNTWLSDPWPVSQAYQQHLLQVQFVDTTLGWVIDRMEETGIYDDALFVVVADHGVVFRTDVKHRRAATADSVGEVAAVPLFIKSPHQAEGSIDDYRAEITDVLPTIADVIGVDLPWSTEGASLVAPSRPVRKSSAIGPMKFGVAGTEKLMAASLKVETFRGGGPFSLIPRGAEDLLGMDVADSRRGSSPLTATVEDHAALAGVDLGAEFLPLVVRGALQPAVPPGDVPLLAVAVNGTIAAMTRPYQVGDAPGNFHALLPPDSLRDGSNRLDIFLVEDPSEGPVLTRIGP